MMMDWIEKILNVENVGLTKAIEDSISPSPLFRSRRASSTGQCPATRASPCWWSARWGGLARGKPTWRNPGTLEKNISKRCTYLHTLGRGLLINTFEHAIYKKSSLWRVVNRGCTKAKTNKLMISKVFSCHPRLSWCPVEFQKVGPETNILEPYPRVLSKSPRPARASTTWHCSEITKIEERSHGDIGRPTPQS